MPRANLEGASLRGCTMDSRMGTHTNLEGGLCRVVLIEWPVLVELFLLLVLNTGSMFCIVV